MRHWLSMLDYSPTELTGLVDFARALKSGAPCASLRGKVLAILFFNSSLRTRTSFESVMFRYGGHAINLNVGADTWNLEHRDGVVMDGDRAEHIKEAAPVLSRYCDLLGVRTFAGLKDAAEDAADAVIRAFARYATVPVVNMESAMEHPCQGLADRMTMEEKLGAARGRRFVLSWAPHVKALPMAVPHSAVLAAASADMHVTIAHPRGYDLNPAVLDRARAWCEAAGANLSVTDDQRAACRMADVLYVKSWGALAFYGAPEAQRDSFRRHRDWMVDAPLLPGRESLFMHCLPVRRNVVMTDAALDDPRCVVVDQAENRLWAQAAILQSLIVNQNPAREGGGHTRHSRAGF
ncbi:MAG TPA: N-acetylornithine carbamoyltransferase [Phycisphaerae bacterium]|jgi:N-acetylornithine carbamoyltransferase